MLSVCLSIWVSVCLSVCLSVRTWAALISEMTWRIWLKFGGGKKIRKNQIWKFAFLKNQKIKDFFLFFWELKFEKKSRAFSIYDFFTCDKNRAQRTFCVRNTNWDLHRSNLDLCLLQTGSGSDQFAQKQANSDFSYSKLGAVATSLLKTGKCGLFRTPNWER